MIPPNYWHEKQMSYHGVQNADGYEGVHRDDYEVGELPGPVNEGVDVLRQDVHDGGPFVFCHLPQFDSLHVCIEPGLDRVLNVLEVIVYVQIIVVAHGDRNEAEYAETNEESVRIPRGIVSSCLVLDVIDNDSY